MNAQRRKEISNIVMQLDGVATELAEAEQGEVEELVDDVNALADELEIVADDERNAAGNLPESFIERQEMMEELADTISDAAENLRDATAEEKPYKMAAAIRDVIDDLETTDGLT